MQATTTSFDPAAMANMMQMMMQGQANGAVNPQMMQMMMQFMNMQKQPTAPVVT